MRNVIIFSTAICAISLVGCQVRPEIGEVNSTKNSEKLESTTYEPENKQQKSYDLSYFGGEAEVSTYSLKRARYNDVHPGEAVLIFVTEPFLSDEQVKLERGSSEQKTSILKLNKIERFTTGVYDYSMYTSVFTPIEKFKPEHPLKVTFSSQDWCGQAFAQINNSNGYEYQHNSYFQAEGDTSYHLEYTFVEDNLFNLARIDDQMLPVDEFQILPSQSYVRTAHIEYKPYEAIGSKSINDTSLIYNYEIPELKRSVRVFMDPQDHNKILKWTETYPTVFDGKLRTSEYNLKESRKIPYWRLNSRSDEIRRENLRIETTFSE
tara:strand:+ start:4213 stop:5175 length:963 start_codon:yes stop_codon:yes gene_type:complete